MSSPREVTSRDSDPTRQMLDELDALIGHMMSLPVGLPDETSEELATPPSVPNACPLAEVDAAGDAKYAAVPSVADRVEARPIQTPASAEELPIPPPAEINGHASDIWNGEALAIGPPQSREPSAADAPTDVEADQPASTSTPPAPAWRTAEARGAIRGGPVLVLLVWVNHLFDVATLPLGPVGRGLRSAKGRGALGWAGLLLLVSAAAWRLAGWFGWTG